MHPMDEEMRRCVDDCLACHRVCLTAASQHCLDVGGRHVEPRHMRLMLACVEICPVGIEHVPIINQMRRALVEKGDMLAPALADQFRRTPCPRQQVAIAPALSVAHQANTIGGGLGRHLEEQGNIHWSCVNPMQGGVWRP